MTARPSHVLLVLGKELREALRDPRTLMAMILFPLVVYPLLSLLAAQVAVNRARQQEARASTVAVIGDSAAGAEVQARLGSDARQFRIVAASGSDDVRAGNVDAAVELTGSEPPAAARILFDGTRDASRDARDRLETALACWLPDRCAPRLRVEASDLSSGRQRGGYLLSKALPLVLMLMILVGAFYPAIDVTAGERERGTLETLLTAPMRRYDLLFGKVLAVALIAALTGVLNLASMSITVIQAIRLAEVGGIPVPWTRALASAVVVIPSAFLFAATFVTIGSFARGFKEAQNLIMPAYFVAILPALVGAIGELPLDTRTAFVPVMNATLLARDLLLGKATLLPALLTLVSTAAFGALVLTLGARFYGSEQFVSLPQRERKGRRQNDAQVSASEALALYAFAFLLFYFVFVPLQQRDQTSGLLLSQWVGLLGLVAVFARLSGRPLAAVLVLGRPSGHALLGGLLVGASAWAGVAVIGQWLVPVPKEVLEQLRKTLLPDDGRGLPLNLLLVALTPAVCEEALFRGPILRGLRSRLPTAAAALITGLLFGLFHLDAWRLLPTTLLGVLLSLVALWGGSIVPAMLAHLANNGILITLATLAPESATETLPTATAALMLTGSVAGVGLGLALLRRSAHPAGARV